MFRSPLRPAFQPDPSAFRFEKEREEMMLQLREDRDIGEEEEKNKREDPRGDSFVGIQKAGSLADLIDLVSPEDSALIALVVFLLCDNSDNDVVLLGILLYVLLSR